MKLIKESLYTFLQILNTIFVAVPLTIILLIGINIMDLVRNLKNKLR